MQLNNRTTQGLRGEPQKDVLVPRFFLTFSFLDVPYISKGSGRQFSLVTKYLFLTFAFFKASLVVGGSMVSKFFKDFLLWEGDVCMKDTDHCVRHRDVHQRNCATVRNEKKLSVVGRSIWTRCGSVLGWSDPTFAHDSVAKVVRGSLQPTRSLGSSPQDEGGTRAASDPEELRASRELRMLRPRDL